MHTSRELTAVQQRPRSRGRRWFAGAGRLELADARATWPVGGHSGGLLAAAASLNAGKAGVSLHRNFAVASFSPDASVRISGLDRAGLERLLRYCARAPFVLNCFERSRDDEPICRLPTRGENWRGQPFGQHLGSYRSIAPCVVY